MLSIQMNIFVIIFQFKFEFMVYSNVIKMYTLTLIFHLVVLCALPHGIHHFGGVHHDSGNFEALKAFSCLVLRKMIVFSRDFICRIKFIKQF